MTRTPNLDAIEADRREDFLRVFGYLWALVSTLDGQLPAGDPQAPACGACAGATVRMRVEVKGQRMRKAWVCRGCDGPPSNRKKALYPPPAWINR